MVSEKGRVMFTPGPWKVIATRYATGERYQIVHGNRKPIAATMAGERPHLRVEADACLIAAAPELYEACEVALASMQSVGVAHDGDIHANDPALKMLETALSKARGDTPLSTEGDGR